MRKRLNHPFGWEEQLDGDVVLSLLWVDATSGRFGLTKCFKQRDMVESDEVLTKWIPDLSDILKAEAAKLSEEFCVKGDGNIYQVVKKQSEWNRSFLSLVYQVEKPGGGNCQFQKVT